MRSPLNIIIALLIMSACAMNAEEKKEVTVTGILKVSRKTVPAKTTKTKKNKTKKAASGKTRYQYYIANGDKRTYLKFDIKDKAKRPKLKPFLKKDISIRGLGTEKIIKDKTCVTFTSVTSIKEVKASVPTEDEDGEVEEAVDPAE